MGSELSLVTDLAVILIAAGVFTVISKALKQPLILGYIIAGFIVGPHLGLFPELTSEAAVEQWSEIGIIFLLFALGLEFSFKKLLKVGSSALITCVTICVGMFTAGIVVGGAMGWSTMECMFLGGLLSMSSTTIIIKTYDEMGLKSKPYAGLIFGTLVVEDMVAVLMMVLLSTMAVSNKFAGGEMVWSLAKLAFFLVLWFLVGIYVIPTLLKKARRFLNDEILLIIAIGLCFGMVALASAAGFSSALGAFVMGSILAETIEGEHISKLVSGIKNLFGAIFFVSVGMMVDPAVIGEHWGTILVIAVVAVCGILVFSTTGTLLAGKSLDTAVHTGFTMAQLGEFSFILASLGCSLGVMRDFIYPVIISVSVITTFTTPYMIKAADPVSRWLHSRLPDKVLSKLNTSDESLKSSSAAEKSEWRKLIRSYLLRVALYSVVLIAVFVGSKMYLSKALLALFPSLSEPALKWIVVAVTLAVMSPLLYGLAINNGSIAAPSRKLLSEKDANKWPILALMVIRILIAVAFVLAVVSLYFDLSGWAVLLIVLGGVVIFWAMRTSMHRFGALERRFIANFNEKELMEKRLAPVASSVKEKLGEYDVHLQGIILSPDSEHIGRTLREMPFRKASGVNIVKIIRGSRSILIPSGDEVMYPYDYIYAVGSSAQLESFLSLMEGQTVEPEKFSSPFGAPGDADFTVEAIAVTEESYLCGKSLRELSMRSSGCMVLSVLRDGSLVTNPGPDFRFVDGDTAWIAGEKASCEFYR